MAVLIFQELHYALPDRGLLVRRELNRIRPDHVVNNLHKHLRVLNAKGREGSTCSAALG